MKKLIVLMLVFLSFGSVISLAAGRSEQRLTKEEFRAKQQAFITEKAGLSEDEAEKFFPLYFELQDEKKQLNDKAWEGVYDARIASDELEKSYFEKFRKILSCKQIYEVQQAEMRFHREWLKNMRGKGNPQKSHSRRPESGK